MDLVFRAERAITADGEISCCIGVFGGRIVAVEPYGSALAGDRIVELGRDVVLLPGLVDAHVHVNEPGRSEWEGFDTATRAAAAGGVTTLVDMPLNSLPSTIDVESLEIKRAAARGRVHVDVGFWGGAVPGNAGELRALHESGVFGFKCFLLHSGVDEFAPLASDELERVMHELREFNGLLIVHAEDACEIERAPSASGRRYADFLASRPPEAEHGAIEQMIDLARRTGSRVHILHLASAGAVPLIAQAQQDGIAITAETCPHYLSFAAEEIEDGATQFKCCPPIREAAHRERLWEALTEEVISYIASDHSPCTPELKCFDSGDFGTAWGGIASLQVGLSAVWTMSRQRGISLTEVVRWMAERPAVRIGLTRKGRIAPGYDADFCLFAPDESFVVDAAQLWHRHPVSAYHGRTLEGVVRNTWLRGAEITGASPQGTLLSREDM